ncbi:MAG: hypothetical protein R3F43_28430 [bacterium]
MCASPRHFPGRSSHAGFHNYFDPITRFGGVWGEPIDGAVNVTVLNAGSGQPEAGPSCCCWPTTAT